ACDLRMGPGEYRLGPVPDGQYYVMAVAFDKADDPLTTLLATRPLRGKTGLVRIENGVTSGPTEVTLREARLTDPPIVIALPVLLAQRQRATETDRAKSSTGPFNERTTHEHNIGTVDTRSPSVGA